MASTVLNERSRPTPDKARFANRVRRFAKPAARLSQLPGFPLLWISSGGAAVVATLTGAFNTGSLALGQRSLFWLLLLGWNLVKWQTWFAFTVRKPADWTRASLVGGVLLNLTLPIETFLCLRLVGLRAAIEPGRTWLYALAISAVLFAVIQAAARRIASSRREAAPTAAEPPADGLLARAATAPDALLAIEAEDHYCRVRRRDGSSALVHYRFADALAEVAGLDGAQVHRGAWVAASGLAGASRERRRWRLRLHDGRQVPVSASHLDSVRSRGWLRRNPSTACVAAPQSAVAPDGSRP